MEWGNREEREAQLGKHTWENQFALATTVTDKKDYQKILERNKYT